MPMAPETAAKIRSHKFGRRRLATDSAWTAYNKLAKNDPVANDGGEVTFPARKVLDALAGSATIQGFVTAMNTAMGTIAGLFGVVPAADQKIKLVSPGEMFIPRSVWYGYIDLATGSLTAAQRTTFNTQEKIYADNAGLLRSAIAKALAVNRALNDAANADATPNPGGAVGDDRPAAGT